VVGGAGGGGGGGGEVGGGAGDARYRVHSYCSAPPPVLNMCTHCMQSAGQRTAMHCGAWAGQQTAVQWRVGAQQTAMQWHVGCPTDSIAVACGLSNRPLLRRVGFAHQQAAVENQPDEVTKGNAVGESPMTCTWKSRQREGGACERVVPCICFRVWVGAGNGTHMAED